MGQLPISEWWDRLDPLTQRWLIEHPGCLVLPRTVANVVYQTLGTGTGIGQDRHGELQLSQEDHAFIKGQAVRSRNLEHS